MYHGLQSLSLQMQSRAQIPDPDPHRFQAAQLCPSLNYSGLSGVPLPWSMLTEEERLQRQRRDE